MTQHESTPPEAPAGAPQTVRAQTEGRAKNIVGRVALILAIVGAVFACIPGALIVGWVLLPAAFVVGIVGLTRKGQRKGTSIGAVILSIVGTIVGVVVFLSLAADAVSDAFEEAGGGETTVVGDDAGAEGTREDPFAFDDVVANDDWTIELGGFSADADAEVAAANEFNDEPTPGTRWIAFDVAATYTGEDSGSLMGLSLHYVTADGAVIATYDAMASGIEPELDALGELYNGATAEGRVAFLVPDSVDGEIRVTPGMLADDVFFAVPTA
ncbi:hypothetical protein [Demequina gelatinilytica]|uniref:hypothetical protein n=1 Tax=Demequina gelatinilytica TaxID=1638980 RepID=UPI0007844D7E|nr:hypothetical protein [Demequina gelatinilytica]